MNGLAGAHLPHDVGALVGFEGGGDAPYGVGLGSQGGAEQLGQAVAVLRGPVEGPTRLWSRRTASAGRHYPNSAAAFASTSVIIDPLAAV